MKKFFALLLLLSPVCLLAQTKPAATSSATFKDPAFIVDGQTTEKAALGSINPDDILELEVIKNADKVALHGVSNPNGLIIITTKKYGAKQYQEVFSSFSDDLESWLTGHGTDDAQFRYFVNNTEVKKDTNGLLKLYHLKKEDIDTVTFVQDEPEGSQYAAKIKIVTKK